MIEAELKITLDAAGAKRLRGHPAIARLRLAPGRTETLVSVYHDTSDHRLAAAGLALRLRKVGRRWVQTIKQRRPDTQAAHGLFRNLEVEGPAPGGKLVLGGPDPQGVLAAIAEAAGGHALEPIFETRVSRRVERLRSPEGGVVELAIDDGAVVAGERRMTVIEAELELVEGDIAAVYGVARHLFDQGPVRFARDNKSARGYRLAREGAAEAPLDPRTAGAFAYAPGATVETVARDVFRDCFAQITVNLEVVAVRDAPEGPHQLRVGLRRLRSAFGVLGAQLGETAIVPLSDEARRLGQVVGRLRDLDVLIGEVVTDAAALGLDAEARDALTAALEARRDKVRAEVRQELAEPQTVRFVFDLAELIETRGWLDAVDYGQSARLATPIADLAAGLLDHRLKKVRRAGRHIERLDPEALHALRKQLKKLRYAVEILGPVYKAKKLDAYLSTLKKLQDTFGALNDAAMADAMLGGADAPGRAVAAAQRGAGWVLGALAVRSGIGRPKLYARWHDLVGTEPFWT